MEDLVGGVEPMLETGGQRLHAPFVPLGPAGWDGRGDDERAQVMRVTTAAISPATVTTSDATVSP
jgi:hypothetical protein